MALDFRQEHVHFPEHAGEVRVQDIIFTFPTTLLRAAVAISGFEIGFTNDEHPVLNTVIEAVVAAVSGATMTVRVFFGIRDNSGDFDDPFRGFVDVLMIVDRA